MNAHEEAEVVLENLLGVDTLLPEQFWGVHDDTTNLSGERALMWAVFADGIDTYRRSAHAGSVRQRADNGRPGIAARRVTRAFHPWSSVP